MPPHYVSLASAVQWSSVWPRAPICAGKAPPKSVLSALESWAAQRDVDWIGLQVVTGNTPAVALYRRLSFVAGATNSYWVR